MEGNPNAIIEERWAEYFGFKQDDRLFGFADCNGYMITQSELLNIERIFLASNVPGTYFIRIPTSIAGMRTVISNFCTSSLFLDTVTGAETKDATEYAQTTRTIMTGVASRWFNENPNTHTQVNETPDTQVAEQPTLFERAMAAPWPPIGERPAEAQPVEDQPAEEQPVQEEMRVIFEEMDEVLQEEVPMTTHEVVENPLTPEALIETVETLAATQVILSEEERINQERIKEEDARRIAHEISIGKTREVFRMSGFSYLDGCGCYVSGAFSSNTTDRCETVLGEYGAPERPIFVTTSVEIASQLESRLKSRLGELVFNDFIIVSFINETRDTRETKVINLSEKKLFVFGYYLNTMGIMKTPAGYDVSAELNRIKASKISEEEKKRKIIELAKSKYGSPYADRESVVRDYSSNSIIASVKGRCLHFNMSLTDSAIHNFALGKIVAKTWERTKFSGLPRDTKKWYEEDTNALLQSGGANIDVFKDTFTRKTKKAINKFERDMAAQENVYKESWDTAMRALEDFRQKQLALNALRSSINEAAIDQQALDMFEFMLHLPKVKYVSVTSTHIVAYTKNIYVNDPRSKLWHDIGTFMIMIKIADNPEKPSDKDFVSIYNTKHSVQTFQAPHVFDNGTMCLGNVATLIKDLYMAQRYHEILAQLIVFLESVNVDDTAGSKICEWPVATQEEVDASLRNEDVYGFTEDDITPPHDVNLLPVRIKAMMNNNQ